MTREWLRSYSACPRRFRQRVHPDAALVMARTLAPRISDDDPTRGARARAAQAEARPEAPPAVAETVRARAARGLRPGRREVRARWQPAAVSVHRAPRLHAVPGAAPIRAAEPLQQHRLLPSGPSGVSVSDTAGATRQRQRHTALKRW